jgi:hypothetical protein
MEVQDYLQDYTTSCTSKFGYVLPDKVVGAAGECGGRAGVKRCVGSCLPYLSWGGSRAIWACGSVGTVVYLQLVRCTMCTMHDLARGCTICMLSKPCQRKQLRSRWVSQP